MKYWWDISQLTDTFQTCTAEISCGFVHQTSFSSCLCGTSGSDDNDIIIIASGCSAQAAAKAGLMDKSARDLCGAGLKRVCELADIPPVLHMGSCVDISRMMILAAELAKDAGLQINQLPVVGCAPEWMSEKAVSIGNYVVGTGIDTFLGVDPYVSGSSEMCELLTEGTRKWTGAAYTVETDIEKLVDLMIERIEEKRTALGI